MTFEGGGSRQETATHHHEHIYMTLQFLSEEPTVSTIETNSSSQVMDTNGDRRANNLEKDD